MARRRLIVVGVVVLGGLAVTTALLVRGDSADATDDDTAGTTATTIVTVEQRDLVESDDYDGTLGYGEARSYTSERAGVVTTVAETGATVAAGGALFSVDFEPTVLLTGSVPAYRALDVDSGDGPDVAQLEQALVALGFGDGVTVDEAYTSSTAGGVEAWEESLGRAEPDGTVELGDVVFAPGPVRIGSITADVGTRVEAASAVLDATSTTQVVTIDLDADNATDLEAGTTVQLTLPDDTETTGTVASVGSETETSSDDTADTAEPAAEPTVPVIVTLDDPATAAAFDSGGVDVSIERSRLEDALVVPVTALVALSEGGYAVQIADEAAESGYRLSAVTLGPYSDGYVAVTGDGVEPGLDVVVPA
jgi:hypothetical protein